MAEDELSKLKKGLRSVLISCPEGIPINKVESDYRSFMGVSLPYKQFGYNNIESFLKSMPDTVRTTRDIAYGVTCDEIKHVTKLINNQRKVNSALKRVQKAKQNPKPNFQPFGNPQRSGPPPGPNRFAYRPPLPYRHMPPPPVMHYPPHATPRHHHGPTGPFGPPRPHPTHQFSPQPPFLLPTPPPTFYPPGMPFPPPQTQPGPDEGADELIFSEREILDLISQENIPKYPQLVHILSLAFPYIYKGSHIAILDLSLALCVDIATAVALDLVEELEGNPAILVCKMQEFHDLSRLESSHKVDCFKKDQFSSTPFKVLTVRLPDLIGLLTTNNDHFYISTTFVIFVDIQNSHIRFLNDLLPPELQYLFLFTGEGKVRDVSYQQPHVVLHKWNAFYTDVAFQGGKLIDNLQQKLDFLNGVPPQQAPTKTISQPYPQVTQLPPTYSQPPINHNPHAKAVPKENGPIPPQSNGTSARDTKHKHLGLKHLAEAAFKANMNMLVQAGPARGKTHLLIEFTISKVDIKLDKLQVILTTPNPKTSSQLFVRLRDYVTSERITDVRAFGYSEGNFDKLSQYIIDQKVHILVIENAHFISLLSKYSKLLSDCKLIGCDELYGSFYTRQVPNTIRTFLAKISSNTQLIFNIHPTENEKLVHCHIPRPYWHIKEDDTSTNEMEKFIVTFFHK